MSGEPERISGKPGLYGLYTAEDLWTEGHTSAQMLAYHLDGTVDVASRKTEFIDRSVTWIASRFGIGEDTAIADFGCGPGLYTLRLARLGAKVTGIDFSGRSIAYAREAADGANLDITYVQRNYLDFETDERFDLVTMIMCDFCALGPEQRKILLDRFRRILKPGGSVLLDVYSLAAFGLKEERSGSTEKPQGGFWSSCAHSVLQETFRYEEEKVTLDRYTVVEPGRTRTVYNWLQYFSPETLEREFREAGFSIEEFFSDVAGAPFDPESGEFAVIAQ